MHVLLICAALSVLVAQLPVFVGILTRGFQTSTDGCVVRLQASHVCCSRPCMRMVAHLQQAVHHHHIIKTPTAGLRQGCQCWPAAGCNLGLRQGL
jgi:hypothetical protein